MKYTAFVTVLVGLFGLTLPPAQGSALPGTALECLAAGQLAARATGTPAGLMAAITLVETGRRQDGQTVPWPWTINIEGKGHWFPTKAKAISFVRAAQRKGARSIDVGCYQINLRWHPDAFRSLEEAFDPLANAKYAAKYLNRLKSPDDAWIKVAGAYHSGHEEFAALYRAKVRSVLETDLIPGPVVRPPPARGPRSSGGVELAWHSGSTGKPLLRHASPSLFGVRHKGVQP